VVDIISTQLRVISSILEVPSYVIVEQPIFKATESFTKQINNVLYIQYQKLHTSPLFTAAIFIPGTWV